MRILILYTEIAKYVTASLELFLERNPDSQIHLVRYPINKEAPFQFDEKAGLHYYNNQDYNREKLQKLATEIAPDLIICSGWINKDYISVCKKFSGKIPVVLVMDNQWEGSFKQNILRLISPFTLKRIFSHVWVPGNPQKEYALKLGFKKDRIHLGFYSGDTAHYSEFYKEFKDEKSSNYPKRFICIARYIKVKNLNLLCESFIELKKTEELKDWELWCLGTGEEFENRVKGEGILHQGFVQPSEMGKFIKDSGFFVLPSLFEPWGVVVHEFASAGFPLVLSNKVGAGTEFLKENENGFLFTPEDKNSLKNALLNCSKMSQDDFNKFSLKSIEMSHKISSEKWCQTLEGILNKNSK